MTARDLSPAMLEEIAETLERKGRPRKNPGMQRPVAVTKAGMAIDKIVPSNIADIKRVSLPGAFRYVEITGKFGKIPSEKAKRLFYEAHTDQNGFTTGRIDEWLILIDQETSDSRLLIRSLRQAAKKQRKSLK